MIDRDQGARLFRVLRERAHFVFGIGDEGVCKRSFRSVEVHVSAVVRPFHGGNEGQILETRQTEVFRIIVVIGERYEIKPFFKSEFSHLGSVESAVRSGGVHVRVAEQKPPVAVFEFYVLFHFYAFVEYAVCACDYAPGARFRSALQVSRGSAVFSHEDLFMGASRPADEIAVVVG